MSANLWVFPFEPSIVTLAITFLLPFWYLAALGKHRFAALRPAYIDYLAVSIALGVGGAAVLALMTFGVSVERDERLVILLHLGPPILTLLFVHRIRDSEPLAKALRAQSGTGEDSVRTAREPMVESVEKMTWDDLIIGTKLREELDSVITLLKDPAQARSYGIRTPRGVLLEGPPGTGKTSIVKVIANTAGLKFFTLKTDEIISQWVGESEKNLTRLFETAAKNAPAVIFVDEIDSIGKARGSGAAAHSESLLNHLLQLIDGISTKEGVYVIGATNRAHLVDAALKRPGRLEKVVFVPLPNTANRMRMFELHLATVNFQESIDFQDLALQTEGFSGAEIKGICNQAAINAFKRESARGDAREYSVRSEDLLLALQEYVEQAQQAPARGEVL